MRSLVYKHILSIMDDYDVFLFDLWGVIVEGDTTYPGVVEIVNEVIARKTVFFVSNAPLSTICAYQRIKSWGVNVDMEMIVTAGQMARNIIANSQEELCLKRPVIYHLSTGRSNSVIEDINCVITDNILEANILLLTLYKDDNEDLNEFDPLFKQAIALNTINICANPDITLVLQNYYRYCAGYFARKIEQYGGTVMYIGKPYSDIYNIVLNKCMSVNKKRILMIGDTFGTDILGANKVGISSALVLTGNASTFYHPTNTTEEILCNLDMHAKNVGMMPDFIVRLV